MIVCDKVAREETLVDVVALPLAPVENLWKVLLQLSSIDVCFSRLTWRALHQATKHPMQAGGNFVRHAFHMEGFGAQVETASSCCRGCRRFTPLGSHHLPQHERGPDVNWGCHSYWH